MIVDLFLKYFFPSVYEDATIYVGGLDEKLTEPLLWELFVQGGPVVNVHMPKDRITLLHQGYGFVEFLSEDDADYACKIMNMIKLYGKPIRVNKASAHQKNLDVYYILPIYLIIVNSSKLFIFLGGSQHFYW
jgi:RNA recognition motif-containing protein